MVQWMKKIPAGTFLVPMLLSALLYTFWPTLFQIGGATEAFLGSGHMDFVIGLISFCSGIGIEIDSIRKLLKRHGVLLVTKLLLTVIFSFIYLALFGEEGILGISAVAFIVTLASVNSALYVSLVNDYGDKIDAAAFGMISIFSIPVVPVFIYSFQGAGGLDFMPVLTILIPLILGIILGNLDPEFRELFKNGVGLLIPVIGWKIGQTLNLIDGVQAGLSGILLAIVFYVLMSPLIAVDRKLLKNDGIVPVAMNAIAAMSSSFPAIVAQTSPAVEPYVSTATAQILAASLVTVVVTPILTKRMHKRNQSL